MYICVYMYCSTAGLNPSEREQFHWSESEEKPLPGHFIFRGGFSFLVCLFSCFLVVVVVEEVRSEFPLSTSWLRT